MFASNIIQPRLWIQIYFIFIVAIESWAQKWDRSFFSDDSNLVAKVDKGINFIRNMNSNSIRANQLSQTLQILLANLGIYPSDSTEKMSISSRTYVIIILMGLHIIMSAAFFVFESSDVKLMADCFWITSTSFIMLFVIVLLTLKRKNVFGMMNEFESAIIERKFNWTNRISCYRI